MKFNLLVFGAAKDIIGHQKFEFETKADSLTVFDLKSLLFDSFPDLKSLASLLIAVNSQYAADERKLDPSDEIAIIPPTSGG